MKQYTKAKFWKCALQVNPAGYIAYRGSNHNLTESEYNQQLLHCAQVNDIKVIGLADHGSVDGIDAIRTLMVAHDIVVFPGFEIATTEKVHFVCLFPENTTRDQLHRYLGALGLTNPSDGIWPTNLGGNDLLFKVNELGGFAYAAHCTNDNGVLRQKLVHVWQNPLLKAAQISGTLDDLKNGEGNKYRLILQNKNQDYLRDYSIGIINAKDVAIPDDLSNPNASCLIKMTVPCFESFKLAFQDSDSRVRLNSDISKRYYSQIISITVIGGYLDRLNINFSEHLNSIIGGRGTGKSTLIEFIRYVFNKSPIAKYAKKQHEEIIKENLGKSKARVEIIIRSSTMNGKRFTISRRFGESSVVKDENGAISSFTPHDLMPEIEIYGQNEIHESVKDSQGQRQILSRFLDNNNSDEDRIIVIKNKLAENRKQLLQAHENISTVEDEVSRLPKLLEQAAHFKSLGLVEKLEIVPKLENEKQLILAAQENIKNIESNLTTVEDNLSDENFLNDSLIESLPDVDILKNIRTEFGLIKTNTKAAISQLQSTINLHKDKLLGLYSSIHESIKKEEDTLEKTFKELPSSEGRSGREVGIQYKALIAEIERIRPKQSLLNTNRTLHDDLFKTRRSLLDDLSSIRSTKSSQYERMLKKLNKKLEGKLRLTISPEADRLPLIQKLLNCNLEGIGEKRLEWIFTAEDFSPTKLSELIASGVEALTNSKLGITPTLADSLVKISLINRLEIEEIELPDTIKIEFNVAHSGTVNYRDLNNISPGQQCTAIMHLLLLSSNDPLLMDQPEDNLDNSFIADRIVSELRSAKIERQFLFATHNANIPVFGDAELICVFDAGEENTDLPAAYQGAIDVPEIRDKAAAILEGGKVAFNQRKAKYGF